MRLAKDTSEYGFWASLFGLLTDREEPLGVERAADLLAAAWWGAGSGIARSARPAPPYRAGLPAKAGEYRQLVRLEPGLRAVTGILEDDLVFTDISQWASFRQRNKPGSVISARQAANPLERFKVAEFDRVRLIDVIRDEIGRHAEVDAVTAERLGTVIDITLLERMTDEERTDLKRLLGEARFFGRDGFFHQASELLIASGEALEADEDGLTLRDEEALRAAFAPAMHRLDLSYEGRALDFFKLCRGAFEAGATTLATWAMEAETDDERLAARRIFWRGRLQYPSRRRSGEPPEPGFTNCGMPLF